MFRYDPVVIVDDAANISAFFEVGAWKKGAFEPIDDGVSNERFIHVECIDCQVDFIGDGSQCIRHE